MIARKSHVELCEVEGATSRGTVVCRVDLTDGKAPAEVMLFPAPDAKGLIKARDKRVFRMSNPERFVASFNAEGDEVPFDLEHASELKSPMGEPAFAVGWIKSLAVNNGAVMASVEWTPDGASLIESKKYRFASPAFTLGENREITGLVSAGLTNRPALKMSALARSTEGNFSMNPELLKLLGLDDKATPEQIAEATKQLQAKIATEASAKVAAEAARVKLETELASAKSQTQPDIKAFVPRADYDATLARVVTLEKARDEEKALAHKAQVEIEIASAMKAGKITPATKAFYEKTCATVEGLSAFREFCSAAPVIAPDNIVEGKPPAVVNESTLTAQDFEVASRMGLSKETLIASVKAAS